MKAIQFIPSETLDRDSIQLVDLPTPTATGHDILVQVEAVALNPVDTKVRPEPGEEPEVIGYDAAGVVTQAGEQVTGLKVGDLVYYAGDVTRPGTNSEFHLVDSRIVAKRPNSIDAAASAALPLTTLTAWESLFDRLEITEKDKGKSILIIGGAGGVGSIAIQLAKRAGLTVIATASRPESADWCKKLGADHTVNHREDLAAQLADIGHAEVNYIANFNNTDAYWDLMGELIAPQGKIVLIVEPSGPVHLGDPLKRKSASVHWEFMFTRSMFTTDDISRQSEILSEVANLVDQGELQTTQGSRLSPINPDNMFKAHQQVESNSTIGKITIHGW